jgi:hypothetical protein
MPPLNVAYMDASQSPLTLFIIEATSLPLCFLYVRLPSCPQY